MQQAKRLFSLLILRHTKNRHSKECRVKRHPTVSAMNWCLPAVITSSAMEYYFSLSFKLFLITRTNLNRFFLLPSQASACKKALKSFLHFLAL